jgi:hypothetical protein
MTNKSGKCHNPTGATGNYSSHVREKRPSRQRSPQQNKVSWKVVDRQSYHSQRQATTSAFRHQAAQRHLRSFLSRDDHAETNPIRYPSPPTNPKTSPQTTQKHTQNTTNDTTTEATSTKTPPPQNNTVTSNDNNKKTAVRTSNTTFNDEFKEPATTTETEQFTLVKKPPRRMKKVTTELRPPKLAKKDKPKTPTPPNHEKPPVPQEPSTLSHNCGSIRYSGIIKRPPSDKPFDEFLTLLAACFQII